MNKVCQKKEARRFHLTSTKQPDAKLFSDHLRLHIPVLFSQF